MNLNALLQQQQLPTATTIDHTYASGLRYYQGEELDWSSMDIAILTWQTKEADNAILGTLQRLSTNFKANRVYYLGEVLPDKIALVELLDQLLQKKVFPIVLSPNPEAGVAQLQAYEQQKELLSLTLIDSKIPFSSYTPNGLINQLLHWHPSLLIHLNCIAYQTYLVDRASVDFLEDKYFDTYRLGNIQAQLEQVEAIVRDTDIAIFDINAISCQAAPARADMNPNGLQAVEACQIMRYLSMSDVLQSLSLVGYDLTLDHRGQTANLLAQLVWFAVEGYYARLGEYPVDKSEMKAYLVDNKDLREAITFYKSPKSDRWWLEIPAAISPKFQLIPCSYQDYKTSCDGELPDRLLNAISRLKL